MLYPASGNIIRKWTQRYRNWDQVLNQIIVLYRDRIAGSYKKLEQHIISRMSRPYSIGISSIARNIQPYFGGRVAAPTKYFPSADA